MPDTKGYRVDRLRRRRRGKLERWQAWTMYALAGAVAFAAVLGAWYLGGHLLSKKATPRRPGYLALITLTGSSGEPVAAALAIKDAGGSGYSLYVIPRDLLLDGPGGEYVFAGDSMTAGTLKEDLQRVINAKVDAVYSIPVSALADLAGGGQLRLSLKKPVQLAVDGTDVTFKDGQLVPLTSLPALMAASGSPGAAAAACSRPCGRRRCRPPPCGARTPAPHRAADRRPRLRPGAKTYLADALKGLTSGTATVAQVPATSRVAEGQFAFVPDPGAIMSAITRKAPSYHSKYTVLVRNGSGRWASATPSPSSSPASTSTSRRWATRTASTTVRPRSWPAATPSRWPKASVLYSAAASSWTAPTCPPTRSS